MALIYANALRVLVWLGLTKTLRYQPRNLTSAWINRTIIKFDKRLAILGIPGETNLGENQISNKEIYILLLLADLIDRQWFHRLWVVQEVGMAKSALALVGNVAIEFGNLMRLAERLCLQASLREHFRLKASRALISNIFPARRSK